MRSGGGGYAEMIATTTLLNRIGAELARDDDVHAMTDVTGFGLLGHGLEMARGSRLRLVIDAGAVPLLTRAADLARQGFVTGASQRNWTSYGDDGRAAGRTSPDWQRHLLTDPQTSGGLLVAVAAPRAAETLLAADRAPRAIRRRASSAAPEAGAPGITVMGSASRARFEMSNEVDVVVIGGGLAGLCCAALTSARLGRRTALVTGGRRRRSAREHREDRGRTGLSGRRAGYDLCPMTQEQAAAAGVEFVNGSRGLRRGGRRALARDQRGG